LRDANEAYMASPNDPLHPASWRALARSLAPFAALADCGVPDARDVASVQAAIRQLPARQRTILLAVRLHDRSLREIARACGLTQEQAEREFAAALVAVVRRVERQRRGRAGRR
jgi:DNA-directed RNA polymerase specialized sigma24 family protein